MNSYDLKIVFDFLLELKVNNDRDWFKKNKDKFEVAKENFELFINRLIPLLKKIDKTINVANAKDCMFRIYKDVRFSKNKDPYKTNFGAVIAKGGRKSNLAGYYIHFEPDNSFIGGGIYMPQKEQLKNIRNDILIDSSKLKKILNNKMFMDIFGGIHGESLKTAPRGFSKEYKDISLINHKHYAVIHPISNDFWFKENHINDILSIFKTQFPFNSYLNSIVSNEKRIKSNIIDEEEFIKNNFGM